MATPQRIRLDVLLDHLTTAAFAVLIGWSLVGLYGTLGGYLEVNRLATLRFLFAIMVLVYSHHFVQRFREWRMRNLAPDERYGFTGAGHTVTGSPQVER
jgi:hypothetical protein